MSPLASHKVLAVGLVVLSTVGVAAASVADAGATVAAGNTAARAAKVATAGAMAKSGTPMALKAQARRILTDAGQDARQYACFAEIVSHESSWNPRAVNPSSGSYGLVQALPAKKLASAGADWRTNPATQIKWGVDYMNDRYGSPCEAWSFWQAHRWY